VRVTSTVDLEPVILWGSDYCSWLCVLKELKLRPVVLILATFDSVDLAQATVGGDCLVILATDLDDLLIKSITGMAQLGLVDGRVTSSLCESSARMGLKRIIGNKPLRRSIPGWTHDSWSFQHCDIGGVTTGRMNGVCLALGTSSPGSQDLPTSVPRDASTVLCVQAPSRKYRPAPSCCVVVPLGCVNLGSSERPYYHGGGLIPGNSDRNTEVLSPGIYAPKGQWALRSLTLEEVLIAKDYNQVLAALMTSGPLTNSFLRELSPDKSIIALARRWGCNGGDVFFNGSRARSEEETEETPRK
jgi:hypothetical protein